WWAIARGALRGSATRALATSIATRTTVTIAEAAATAAFTTPTFGERTPPILALTVATGLLALLAVLGRLEQCAARQVHATLAIDLGDQHLQLVANFDHVLDARHTIVRQLRDVDQAFLAGQDLDEGAKGQDSGDLASVDLARFDFAGERLDPVDGF